MREVGTIGNYYGGLSIKEENGKFFWSIEDWSGVYWEEIPAYLYDAIVTAFPHTTATPPDTAST